MIFVVERTCKEISSGAELKYGNRICSHPLCRRGVFCSLVKIKFSRKKELPDLVVFALCDHIGIFFLYPFHGKNHVRLARAKPDISNKNLIQFNMVTGIDGHVEWPS